MFIVLGVVLSPYFSLLASSYIKKSNSTRKTKKGLFPQRLYRWYESVRRQKKGCACKHQAADDAVPTLWLWGHSEYYGGFIASMCHIIGNNSLDNCCSVAHFLLKSQTIWAELISTLGQMETSDRRVGGVRSAAGGKEQRFKLRRSLHAEDLRGVERPLVIWPLVWILKPTELPTENVKASCVNAAFSVLTPLGKLSVFVTLEPCRVTSCDIRATWRRPKNQEGLKSKGGDVTGTNSAVSDAQRPQPTAAAGTASSPYRPHFSAVHTYEQNTIKDQSVQVC